ncbi:MAG: Hsp70 family protein [Phenylobacterium sp.]|uniref:Hsp70 family protein n=1 Tax=Phenylobacterium sp. TaxID=1871053 RepID=UPI002A291ABB|nr:Hsp70 family protein [Phenylobacterium sp.]MDD3838788.1 Hsp70 family protein [Phenylobacterium sp.]MDX9999267.1 Hsp70 family protein [Phenylobacterium sp.]
MSVSIGIDFGTTNTVVALAEAGRPARLVRFAAPEGEIFAFRSALSYFAPPERPRERTIEAGPWAIDAYVEDPVDTRFIQSFKTFAASESFTETEILGRRYQFEDLLSAFLLRLKDYAGAQLAELPQRVIVGRPVTFAGGSPNAELAIKRYETAFRRLGFTEILYAYEPVGAAFFFARELDHDATVLVGDFGGGTSDFSIIRFTREGGQIRATPLGRSGVGVAGDAFDYRIIDRLVSPQLGKGGDYVSFGKVLPIPNRYYTAFARWDQLALMRASRDMREIRSLVRQAKEPEKLERLVEVLDENYGYLLYKSVSRLKETLSAETEAEFRFEAGNISIVRRVARTEFEDWIAPELSQIAKAVGEALEDAQLGPADIDRVFLTGGSSLVPAVRRIFQERFDPARIETGAELESIASGLALMGWEPDLGRWVQAAA